MPGNLIFYEGNVLSQTHTEVAAFPQLEIKLAEMDRLVKANPDDPVALTDRGDYLLDKGDLGGAIADFRKALKNKPPPVTLVKARTKLYEAFTEYFQRDFNKAEEYLNEYEDVCRIDLTGKEGAERTALMAEERRRRANFLCLVGKGREAQNRLIEAFEKYLELGAEAKKDELIQVVDEPSVKAAPDVWSQGRIAAMVLNATDAKQKKALEDLIAAKWRKLKESSAPMEDLRKFVGLFGSLFSVGKEARLALAERLMEDTEVNSLLEAEQQLSLMRGEQETPEVAARAIEALARLNTRKGLLEDAAYYYRLLGEKYPKVMVDGKKGEEYLEDLATDKRFLPYLDQTGRFRIHGKVDLRFREEKGNFAPTSQSYQFAHSGEPLPFFARNKLSLQMDWSHQLKLHDSATGEERWKPGLSLTRTQFQQIVTSNGQPHRVKFGYQTLGHLVVLQLGHMVYGVDPLNKGRVLWERNLSSLPGVTAYQSLSFDPRDNSVVVAYSDGWMQRLGETGPLQGGVICLQMRDSLAAVDPVTGRTLWTRSDVNSRTHVFGDEQHIYVVNMGGQGRGDGHTGVPRLRRRERAGAGLLQGLRRPRSHGGPGHPGHGRGQQGRADVADLRRASGQGPVEAEIRRGRADAAVGGPQPGGRDRAGRRGSRDRRADAEGSAERATGRPQAHPGAQSVAPGLGPGLPVPGDQRPGRSGTGSLGRRLAVQPDDGGRLAVHPGQWHGLLVHAQDRESQLVQSGEEPAHGTVAVRGLAGGAVHRALSEVDRRRRPAAART